MYISTQQLIDALQSIPANWKKDIYRVELRDNRILPYAETKTKVFTKLSMPEHEVLVLTLEKKESKWYLKI